VRKVAGLPASTLDIGTLKETVEITARKTESNTNFEQRDGPEEESAIENIAIGSPHVWQKYREPI
jgi:hypothetical protein